MIPENKIVVGEGLQTSVYDELNDICNQQEIACIPDKLFVDGRGINQAKSKCDPRDKWNQKTGVDVVSAKLDYKEHMRKARKLEKTLVTMNSLMRKMENVVQTHYKKAKAIRHDLENYYGGIYE